MWLDWAAAIPITSRVNLPSREPPRRVRQRPTPSDRGLSETPPTMPKSQAMYYAVKVGRGGPKIYETWKEVRRQPSGRDFVECSMMLHQCSEKVTVVLEHVGNTWIVIPLGRSIGIPGTNTSPSAA